MLGLLPFLWGQGPGCHTECTPHTTQLNRLHSPPHTNYRRAVPPKGGGGKAEHQPHQDKAHLDVRLDCICIQGAAGDKAHLQVWLPLPCKAQREQEAAKVHKPACSLS